MSRVIIKYIKQILIILVGMLLIVLIGKCNYLFNKNSIKTTYYQEKVDQFKIIGATEANILMIGDSLIDNAEWGELIIDKTVVNRGIQGLTSTSLLTLMPLIQLVDSPVVVVMIGINDIRRGATVEEININHQKLVSYLLNHYDYVLINSLVIRTENMEHSEKVLVVNHNLLMLTKQYSEVKYIDLHKHLTVNAQLSEKYSIDGVHLNGLGYQFWYQLLLKAL
ncbi:MAG: hypothetical protein GY808_08280 [Gammaproteobacteria bacterium]|nr:hypothetical protein [Gammaproteobacteria bacterium]